MKNFMNKFIRNIYEQFLFVFNVNVYSKIMELEEELKVVGNSLKSLEVSEEKVRLIHPYKFDIKNYNFYLRKFQFFFSE